MLRDPTPSRDLVDDTDEDSEPSGTFAGAGIGWLAGSAGDRRHAVRIEVHDVAPPNDHAEFDDVLETPYRAVSGELKLTEATSGFGGRPTIVLGGPGGYRVRVTRRLGATAQGDGDRWLLRFWPDPAIEPPVWLARSRPGVGPGMDGWRTVLPYSVWDVANVVVAIVSSHGGPVTVDDLEREGREPGWLDSLLWQPPPVPAVTGDVGHDRYRAAVHAQGLDLLAGHHRAVENIAGQLGVPPVRRKRDVLPLLVAAGLLVRDETGRYSQGRPSPVLEVLSLPPKLAQTVRGQDTYNRFGELAQDVLAVRRWAPREPLEATAELARRLLISEAELSDALTFVEAERQGKRRQPSVAESDQADPAEPFGPPPRAGLVDLDGAVVVWRDGEPVELAHLGNAHWVDAWQTRNGVLVVAADQPARLVSDSGAVTVFDHLHRQLTLLDDGRRVALVGWHSDRLTVTDLDSGAVQTMPWPRDRPIALRGAYQNTVFFRDLLTRAAMRWTPGTEPTPHDSPDEQIDPVTGTCRGQSPGSVAVTKPDGTTLTWPSVDSRANLAPGGEQLWTFQLDPPKLTLFTLENHPFARPQTFYLPESASYRKPVWEDAEHLLFATQTSGVRLSTTDDHLQPVPTPATSARPVIFVRPLLNSARAQDSYHQGNPKS